MKKIYLDYAATTPVDEEVLKEMLPYFNKKFGNASSIHSFGQEAIAAIDEAREKIAKLFNCDFSEIIFTGSATEANNLAIKGLVHESCGRKSCEQVHIVSTQIEHESALEPLKELERAGHKVTYLSVDKDGLIKISDLEKSIKNNTILISIIYANNEIGTIQPIKEIGRLLEKINKKRRENKLPKIYFHTDAVQALNYLECRPDWLKADLLTFSGHKIYGPKGIGGLYIRNSKHETRNSKQIQNSKSSNSSSKLSDFGFRISDLQLVKPIVTGAGQEFGLRSGTENVPYIVGLAKAVELAISAKGGSASGGKNREKRSKYVLDLRNKLWKNIIKYNKGAKLNGSLSSRLPNNLNIRFPGIDNETLIVALDQAGIAVSAGSACSSRALAASHVLTAIGLTKRQAKESIRITLGKNTTKEEIKKAAKIINKVVKRLKDSIL